MRVRTANETDFLCHTSHPVVSPYKLPLSPGKLTRYLNVASVALHHRRSNDRVRMHSFSCLSLRTQYSAHETDGESLQRQFNSFTESAGSLREESTFAPPVVTPCCHLLRFTVIMVTRVDQFLTRTGLLESVANYRIFQPGMSRLAAALPLCHCHH